MLSLTTTSIRILPSSVRRHAIKLAVALFCAVITLLLLGAGTSETRIEAGATREPAPRTAAESQWNQQEDAKASGYVGQPAIY